MENNPQQIKIQGLIDQYLKLRVGPAASEGTHLDENSLAAFAEGSLNEREAKPIVSHLVACSFCRHISAELVRLDLAFAENEAIAPAAENREPSRVSEVLSGLLSRIFGTTDGAVFAHTEDDDKDDKKEKSEDKKEEE
jgi:hypothetical protein